jgi:hypothetical protein
VHVDYVICFQRYFVDVPDELFNAAFNYLVFAQGVPFQNDPSKVQQLVTGFVSSSDIGSGTFFGFLLHWVWNTYNI